MSAERLFVIAAVPLPADVGLEERRSAFWLNKLFGSGRKRKLSRDIGTSITEEQLYLESPPASPGSPGSLRSPRSPTSLPDLVTCCERRPPRSTTAAVFVFPESGPPPEPSAELRCRLAGLDGAGVARVVTSGGAGGAPPAPPAPPASPAVPDAEMVEVGRCLRRCADEFELSRRASSRQARPARPPRAETLALGVLAAAAVCVCCRLCK